MVAFKIDTFGGMIPAISDELLPVNQASLSVNTWLYSGSLIALPETKVLIDLKSVDSTKVFRIPASYTRSNYLYNSIWIEFVNTDTDVVRAPVFNDVHDRYYMASTSNAPLYNTRERLKAFADGDPGFHQAWLLGIPPPTVAPTLVVTGGSVQLGNARVATTVNGAFATDFANGKTVDGIEIKTNDRILIKDQTAKADNGVFIVTTGAPTRAADMNSGDKFVKRVVKVMEGVVNSLTSWKCTNETPPDIDDPIRDAINFEEVPELPLTVTRSYVYTWVSFYGEESAPSVPVVKTGIQDGSWDLSALQSVPDADLGLVAADPEHARRYLTHTRIYRTITSTSGVATFFLVAELPINTLTYSDTLDDDEISLNDQLESFAWTPPPVDLKGLVVMWNGIIAGWRENELWMCEPYRPHAWPARFVQTLEFPIIGMGVAGQTLVVCTAGNPVTVNGSLPEHMTSAKVPNFEPCTSRDSILSSATGVFFISPNGLILCGQGGAVNVTESLLTRDKWKKYTGEAKLRAAWFGSSYYAFGSVSPDVFEPTAWAGSHNDFKDDLISPMEDWVSKFDDTWAYNGILIDPTNERIAFNLLTSDSPVMCVQNDPWSGDLFIIRDKNVNWLDPEDINHSLGVCTWKSKIMQTSDKKNLGVMRIYFKIPELAFFDDLAPWGWCTVYADDRPVYTRGLMKSGELWKLPSGFKADYWQYEIQTFARILNIQIASNAKELISV